MAGRRPFKKYLTAGDINDRLSIPASWRDCLLPQVADSGKVSVRIVDDKGDLYILVMKVRKNGIKPEFMAKGWKRFVRKRKLLPGDIVIFSQSEFPGVFRVEVREVGPTLQLGLVQPPSAPLVWQDQPAAELDVALSLSLASPVVQESTPPPAQHLQDEQAHETKIHIV